MSREELIILDRMLRIPEFPQRLGLWLRTDFFPEDLLAWSVESPAGPN